jgi:uncharacterized protein (TIGR00297 family)
LFSNRPCQLVAIKAALYKYTNHFMLLLLFIFLCIGVATAATQVLSVRFPAQVLVFRKLLHVLAVLGCAFAISEYDNTRVLAFLFLLFSVLLFGVVRYRWLLVSRGESWGIALFPLAFGVLLLLPGLDKAHVVSAAMVLALADPLAGWAGSTLARRYWVPLLERKSVLGSAVFFATALSILLWRYGWSTGHCWPLALLALLATGAEMFSWRGSDNLTIPFVVALVLQQWQNGALPEVDTAYFLTGGLLLGPVFYWRRWLSAGGSNAAVWMGLLLTAQLGLKPLLLPLVFLVAGSLCSKLNPEEKEKQGRSALQVFANGGLAMLLALLSPVLPAAWVDVSFTLIFAVANADTMSSEIGKYYRGQTYDILRWQKITPGLSGGVSVVGTLAGLFGSAIMVLLAGLVFPFSGFEQSMLVLGGFGGMLLDSILGSVLQAKYRVAGQIEERGAKAQLVRGLHWCTNDWVNLLSILGMVLLGLGIMALG